MHDRHNYYLEKREKVERGEKGRGEEKLREERREKYMYCVYSRLKAIRRSQRAI
jgi:hypothetical protein